MGDPQDLPQDDRYDDPPQVSVPRPRRKPADLSTLMERYTARAEEQEGSAPPPSRVPPPPAPPAHKRAGHAGSPGLGPQDREPVPWPAPAPKNPTDPKFVALPLPAEPPEVEPGSSAAVELFEPSSVKGRTRVTGPIPGTIIVSDGQVQVIEDGVEDGAEGLPVPPATDQPGEPQPGGPSAISEPLDARPDEAPTPVVDPGSESVPADDNANPPDVRSQYLPSDDPDYASVAIRAQTETAPAPQFEPAQDDGHNGDWPVPEAGEGNGGDQAYAPEPPHVPEEPPEWWPPEPPVNATVEPIRYDGVLPYQRPMHQPQDANLADWDAANERLDFDPAWQDRRGGGRGLVWFLLFLVVAGAGGYGVWSGEARRLVEFVSTFMNAPNSATGLTEEPATQQPPEIAANEAQRAPDLGQPPAAASTPLAPVAAPIVSAEPGDRVAPDPNLRIRQIEGPAAQTTTLWWQAKTVTQFPVLTPAELAGQPQPPTARGESVMAPSGPAPGAANRADAQVNSAEIARIDDLILSFAIQKADAAIAPLLAATPQAPPVLMLSGRTALAKSANFEALTVFDKVLAAGPADAKTVIEAKIGRGRALVNLGRATEAQAIAAEVLAASPDHLGAMWLSVEAQGATGALEAAMEICGRIEAAGAEPGSAEWCRGVASKRARRPLQAESIFINALQSGSRDFVSTRQLYFRFKGYFDGAIDGFSSDDLINAATRCTAVRDCNTAGL
ncbi:hypothetical protein MNBD_ALPHA09-221 [hydrothermal vent metagenome]|uniref:Tetratricopeptide repeat protein n=1 Tax=hydrothermal vent metagenome TaxID=652676 RepID=A0A3B0THV9_9ZZZZ